MPKAFRNPRTGLLRRQQPHYITRKRRSHAAYARDIVDAKILQDKIAEQEAMVTLSLAISAIALFKRTEYDVNQEEFHDANKFVLLVFVFTCTTIKQLFVLHDADSFLMDTTPEEEAAENYSLGKKYARIDEFESDDHSKGCTNCIKRDLHLLIQKFELPEWNRVRAGKSGRFYKFHHEELLIYMLVKMKDGLPHTAMSDKITGGDPKRWSYGNKYIVQYIDQRYHNLIGPNGLSHWILKFPKFAEVIREAVGKTRSYVDSDTGVTSEKPGVVFPTGMFAVVGFVDCKDYKICKPHTGPNSDYIGSIRRSHHYEAQRAVFSGHRHQHGVRVLILYCLMA